MRRLGMVLAVLGAIALDLEEAEAQVSFGAQASYAENTDLGVGARIYVGLPVQGAEFVGSLDRFFPRLHNREYFEVNANALYSLPLAGMTGFRPYVGGGLNIARGSLDVDLPEGFGDISTSDTEMGLNLIGGLEFGFGPIKPFAELRAQIAGGEQIVLTGGIRL